jgi:hypothetical protein
MLSQNRVYDQAGNVDSLSTTQAAMPDVSGSGGGESQNSCYDEQNRLVWAGNSGSQPGAGNGACGTSALSNSLSGASYNNSYVYTHLGRLWQSKRPQRLLQHLQSFTGQYNDSIIVLIVTSYNDSYNLV